MSATLLEPRVIVPPQLRVRHQLTLQEYRRAVEAGAFGPDARMELLAGELFDKMTMHPPHAAMIALICELLIPQLRRRASLRAQLPLELDDRNCPEPDVCIVTPREDGYRSGHPAAGDVLVLIEIADASLAFDRGFKREIYARGGIAEYWIVNLAEQQVEIHTEPLTTGAFGRVQIRRPGEQLAVGSLATLEVQQLFA